MIRYRIAKIVKCNKIGISMKDVIYKQECIPVGSVPSSAVVI